MTISDRLPVVRGLLGGREDKDTEIANWIANAYQSLGSSLPFETLEDTATPVTVAGTDNYPYPSTARGIKSIVIGIPAANPQSFPPLIKKNMALLDRYGPQPGTPSLWAPFGGNYFLRQVPNDSYSLTIRFWIRPQIQRLTGTQNADPATTLFVPDDWIEILDYSSQLRGYMDLQEFDKAQVIRVLLYGDPANTKKEPGLIKANLRRIQAEHENNQYGLRPRIRRYAHVQ